MSSIPLQKRKIGHNGGQVMAYGSEADTLWVAPDNPCLSCHQPHDTHNRWSADAQLTIGADIGGGAKLGVSLTDSSKATFSAGASAGIGFDVTITERSNAGTSAMPVIGIGFEGENTSTSQDSLQFSTAGQDNTKVGN